VTMADMKARRVKVGEPLEVSPMEFEDIPGSEIVKRGLEVALAGGHPILLLASAGSYGDALAEAGGVMAKEAGLFFDCLVYPVCPCGAHGTPDVECKCGVEELEEHYDVLAAELDGFDLVVECVRPRHKEVVSGRKGESAEVVMRRVRKSGDRERPKELDDGAKAMMRLAMGDLGNLDYDRTVRVAATIAALDGCDEIGASHACEAIQYRFLNDMWVRRKEKRVTVDGRKA